MEKNVIFTCGTPGCSRSFSVFSTLKAHISRNHQKISISQRKPHFNLCDVSFKCHIEMCAFQCKDINDFFTHLRYHIRGGVSVACPFKKCRNTYIDFKKYVYKSSYQDNTSITKIEENSLQIRIHFDLTLL